jgi:hypothetical protein
MKTWQLKAQFVMPRTRAGRRILVEVLDAQYVGQSTVFVSHAYGYNVRDSFEVMLRYEETHPGSIFWFDPFSLNQHGEGGVVDTKELEKAFGLQIKSIGATLIVASPWDNPSFLNRAWYRVALPTLFPVSHPVLVLSLRWSVCPQVFV